MKICQFAMQFFPVVGGGSIAVHYLSQALTEAGHDVAVLAPGKREMKMEYRFDSLKPLQRNVSLEKALFKNLDGQKKRFDFDILHAHFAWPAGYVAALWGKKNGVPTVITCHGIDLNTDSRIGYGFRLQSKLRKKIEIALKEAGAVICVSRFLAGKAIDAGCPENTLHIILNGVSLKEFYPSKPDFHRERYVLFLGNLRRVKGADLLLSAFKLVARELKDIKLYLVGEGEEKMSLVMSALHSPRLTDRVRFFKKVTGEEKVRFFNDSLFFVCPSRVEALGIVNLEAMASAKPVVAFDVGGIGELIADGENGFLIKPYDIDLFSQAIKKLVTDRDLRIKMGRESLKRVRRYDWQSAAAQHIELYSSLRLAVGVTRPLFPGESYEPELF